MFACHVLLDIMFLFCVSVPIFAVSLSSFLSLPMFCDSEELQLHHLLIYHAIMPLA